jgi:serine/threonine-protein kinase
VSSEDDDIDSFLRAAAHVPSLPQRGRDLEEGTLVGRHRIVRELGRGGMGVVYEAEDVELSRRVALKLLLETKDDRERRARFLREARAAALLSHPNIATVFDIGETEDGAVFIAMELVRGSSLRELLDARGALPVDEALRIALQIARGLAEAHAAGVVHRDLKPDNVMIDEDGNAKIVDFGLAKMIDGAVARSAGVSTQDGKLLGTPSYMAPEQAKSSSVGPTADVFSLGVVLFELLTGTRPFAGATVVDVLVAIARDEPSPPSKRMPAIPRAVDRVVMKCLAKDPTTRWENAAAVADALEAASREAPKSRTKPLVIAAVVVASAIALRLTLLSPTPTPTPTPPPPPTPTLPPTLPLTPSASSSTAALPSTSPQAAAASTAVASTIRPRVPAPSRAEAPKSSASPAATFDPLAHQK